MGCPDGRCDGSGFLYDEDKRKAYPCSCRPARMARKRAAAIAGRIPKRYREVSFGREPLVSIARANPDVAREVRVYIEQLSENLAAGRGIWFTGDTGTGKTTFAMLISKAAMEADHTVAIFSLPRLLSTLRETYNEESRLSLPQFIDRLCSVDLLHIEDLGAEQSSEWVLEQLYTIVNTRYEDGKAVPLTTNLVGTPGRLPEMSADEEDHPATELVRQIGKRTVSRIWEMCGDPKPLFGHDRRLEYRPEPPAPVPVATTTDPFDDAIWDEERPRYGQPRRAP
jgi:DNA replication protein DnaC